MQKRKGKKVNGFDLDNIWVSDTTNLVSIYRVGLIAMCSNSTLIKILTNLTLIEIFTFLDFITINLYSSWNHGYGENLRISIPEQLSEKLEIDSTGLSLYSPF